MTTQPDDLGALAPEFLSFTKNVLFGDIWKRPPFSPREKSLITVTALATLNRLEQIDYHLGLALDNGLSAEELVAAITHLAFYAGWPSAMTGLTHLKRVLDQRQGARPEAIATAIMKILQPADLPSNEGPKELFTGTVRVTPLIKGEAPSCLACASVAFQPGARSAWHTHPKGQLLVVTAGAGLIQEEGKPVRKLHAGDVIWTPPGVRHWHGAAAETALTHLAIQEALNGRNVEWMEKVTDAEYGAGVLE